MFVLTETYTAITILHVIMVVVCVGAYIAPFLIADRVVGNWIRFFSYLGVAAAYTMSLLMVKLDDNLIRGASTLEIGYKYQIYPSVLIVAVIATVFFFSFLSGLNAFALWRYYRPVTNYERLKNEDC